MPFRSRTSFTTATTAHGSDLDVPLPIIKNKAAHEKAVALEKSASVGTSALSDTLHGTPLPPPVVQGSGSSSKRGKKKNARVDRGLRVHWAQFKRRIGTGTAPSTSSAIEPDESGDSYSNGRARQVQMGEEEEDGVDEVVVDREWSNEIKSSSCTHSENGGTPDRTSNPLGTNTDGESLFVHPEGFWASCGPLIFLRWRCWPFVHDFFVNHFMDAKSELHYSKENWFMKKNLALWSSAFLVVNWVLAMSFIQKPITVADEAFYYGVAPALTFPVFVFVMYDFPRDRPTFYQCWVTVAIWQWALYNIILMYLCGYYGNERTLYCGTRDFLTLFYYTTAMQTVGLFGLKINRFPAMLAASCFFGLACGLIIPIHTQMVRNLINFLCFQSFLLYIHYMRENAERRLYTLRDQLKIQFRATQKAQVNERKAADSKRRLTSYVFHEVRVPLNTALLAVQNMEASGSVAKAQDIEFRALEGSLSMMSKVLNDVLDFNRMDSGRFESVLKPYSFHQVMRSMFVPLRLATDARGLEFVIDLDKNIDEIARRALHEALGETSDVVEARLKESLSEDGIVVGDETRLRQIITNLASNACKFTPAGGKLTVTTKLVLPGLSPPDASVSACDINEQLLVDEDKGNPFSTLENGQPLPHRLSATHLTQHNNTITKPPPTEWIVVRIEVTDTGYGIRPKDMVQSKLFSAFNQTEQGRLQGGKGTGLGLALVRQIVKLSGGRLGVRSKAGVGSTFWVELPLGVGVKATPVFTMPRDDFLDTPSSLTRTMRSATQVDLPLLHTLSDSIRVPLQVGSQSTSALHSIMEQGGLVEISTKRDGRTMVLTRAIGDPSTGTQPTIDDTTPPAVQEPPPALTTDSTTSSSTTVRPRLSQLPKPRTFSLEPRSLLPALRRRCKVATAENGEIALEMILGMGQRATPSEEDTGSVGLSVDGLLLGASDEYRYAVIFLDNQMPVLSGLDLVTKLRELGRKDFVVGVTGNALLTDQQEYLEAGADYVLTKPVLEKSLKSMLVIADERRKRGPPSPLEPLRPSGAPPAPS
ncbi:uncharacterized protein B0H18DRAFT_1116910 [Fomitopsis serialis]|uniref:uncharacterized protein n=1 Tax=Fomitopsis serialis TaxID=139415 RepID=UPI00200798DE|nr:uncharacterized protein B0H18DRAFT_1116910 [Neoantrodia serialis]KAH9930211.1 hypothetical protein B0H18DRAFT_1116910 [Neoantrodia serialis]